MPHIPKPFFRKARRTWYVQFDGQFAPLAQYPQHVECGKKLQTRLVRFSGMLCDVLWEHSMPDFPDTSYSLIERVQDLADEAARVEFLRIYQPVVYRMARRRGLQDADAQDVIQQVFISISRSIDGWKAQADQPPFRAWLTTVARNAITNALTRQPRDRASGSSSVVEVLHAQPAPEDTTSEIIKEARREIVWWATEQIRSEFTEQTWEIFWQTSVEGVAIAEVASSTGRSVGAIYVTRHRVLARLKEKVADVSHHWDCPNADETRTKS